MLAALDEALDLRPYAGVDETFSPEPGPCTPTELGLPEEEQTPCCSIGSVYVGDEVDFAAGNDDVVLAPDESYAVDVGNFVDTIPRSASRQSSAPSRDPPVSLPPRRG